MRPGRPRRRGFASALAVPLAFAFAATVAILPPLRAAAAEIAVERAGLVLRYDDATWRETAPVPPVRLVLACLAPACAGALLTLTADPRPLPSPGAGAFTPGAALTAAIGLRVQALTPEGRLQPVEAVVPARAGDLPAYRARYTVEDRHLQRSEAAILLVPVGDGIVLLRLSAPRLSGEALHAFDRVVATLKAADRP